MKISVNDEELFSLTETQKQVIANDIPIEILEDDLKRRLQYILMHKHEQCYKRLRQEWEPKLIAGGVKMMPTDHDEFCKLVFSHPEYKHRSQRDNISQDTSI